MRRRELRFYGTFGPSCQTEEILMQLLQTGMTGIRLNLSHTGLEACGKWIENYQNAQKAAGIKADLLIDLQGPELRLGVMKQSLEVRAGEQVVLIFTEDY